THETVSADLEERRLIVVARPLERGGHRVAYGEHVLAVHFGARDRVRLAALVHVLDGRGALDRRAHAVLVVLDDVDHGQLPEPRHVQRLVERAVVHGGLTHEAHDRLVAAAILDGERHTGRDGYVSADDAVP